MNQFAKTMFRESVQRRLLVLMAVLEKKIDDWVAAKKSGAPRG